MFADQEHDRVIAGVIVDASDESVTALDAMDEIVVPQKIERAIDRDWRRAPAPCHLLHDLIGAERFVAGEQSFEHVPAHRRQPLRSSDAQLHCVRNGGARTGIVIVVGRRKNGLWFDRRHRPVAFCR